MIFMHIVLSITFFTLGINSRRLGHDCGQKTFRCVNETHFQMCMDLGNGVLTTIGDFIVKCPDDTQCDESNSFECELRKQATTPVTLNVASSNVNENVEPLLPPDSPFVDNILGSTKNTTFDSALVDGTTTENITTDSLLNEDATTMILDTTETATNTEQSNKNVTTENIFVLNLHSTFPVFENTSSLPEAVEKVTVSTEYIPYGFLNEKNTTEYLSTLNLEVDGIHIDLMNPMTHFAKKSTSNETNIGITTTDEDFMFDNKTNNEELVKNSTQASSLIDTVKNVTEIFVGTNVSSIEESTSFTSEISIRKNDTTNILENVAELIQNANPHKNLSVYNNSETLQTTQSSLVTENVLTDSALAENVTIAPLGIENNSLTKDPFIATTTSSSFFESDKSNNGEKVVGSISVSTEANQTKSNIAHSDVAEESNFISNTTDNFDLSLNLTLHASITFNLKMTQNSHLLLNVSGEAIIKELIEEIKILEAQYFGEYDKNNVNRTFIQKSFEINKLLNHSKPSHADESDNVEYASGFVNISVTVTESSKEMNSQAVANTVITEKDVESIIFPPLKSNATNEMEDLFFVTETVNINTYNTTHTSDSTDYFGTEVVHANVTNAVSTSSPIETTTIGTTTNHDTTPTYTKDNLEATASNIHAYTSESIKENSDSFNCTDKEPGFYVDQNSVNHFLICVGKCRPMRIKCYENTFFDSRQKKCVDLVTEFKCEKEGKFVDEINDQYYYICLRNDNSFKKFKLKCKTGLRVNRETLTCEND